jgi:hypothetical protein
MAFGMKTKAFLVDFMQKTPNLYKKTQEVCRIDGFWAYRIRPYNLLTGRGGNGDHILEISSSTRIPKTPLEAQ